MDYEAREISLPGGFQNINNIFLKIVLNASEGKTPIEVILVLLNNFL